MSAALSTTAATAALCDVSRERPGGPQPESNDPGNRAIVDAVVQLGRAFGLRVVAEGVKDGPTWDTIAGLGGVIAQGFHLSPPLPADQLALWLKARRG
jgi:EAL domain-containing protein (putative c-di-GMP-specific phosphodiesterase class I)